MKKVLMFAGQGSQVVGMGQDLFRKYGDLVREADALLGYSIEDLCMGKFADLNRTLYTQVALYFVNHLLFLEWKELNKIEDVVFGIGHSLGEYNALTSAGFLSVSEGLKLIQKRAELMDKEKGGKMAAVLGLSIGALSRYLTTHGSLIDVANINSKEQIVISGLEKDFDELLFNFKEDKIKAIPLNVSGAFHSRYMKKASDEFSKILSEAFFNMESPLFPVIANKTALPYSVKLEEFKETLAEQINHSVRWVETIEYIRSKGEFEYVEIAVKPVLSSLLKRI